MNTMKLLRWGFQPERMEGERIRVEKMVMMFDKFLHDEAMTNTAWGRYN